jgi:hypothetical protein
MVERGLDNLREDIARQTLQKHIHVKGPDISTTKPLSSRID